MILGNIYSFQLGKIIECSGSSFYVMTIWIDSNMIAMLNYLPEPTSRSPVTDA